MPTVTVEVANLAAASRAMARQVADPLVRLVGDGLAVLQPTGGMAGDDPPARAWAAEYDRAAPVAITAAEDVINACYRVSAMLAATARNYAQAEVASTVRGHHVDPVITGAVATLPDETRIGIPADIPSACADPGNLDLPIGWHYVVHHLGGYVWPNGHQDRLHRAAAAWQASATALEDYAFDAVLVDLGPLLDGLPEGPDISTVCNGLGDHLHAVARAHRALGRACTQLATHIDHAHSRVEHEMVELAAWTGGIQTVGAVAAAFSFGTAEAPAQAAQLERILAAALAVKDLLSAFAASVRSLALTIGPIGDAAAGVRAAVAWLRELRIVQVEVTAVPGLRVYSTARIEGASGSAITGTEMTGEEAALGRLALSSSAAERAAQGKRMRQLERKFKHATDFGVYLPRGKEGFAAFDKALEKFVSDPTTRRVSGTYRSTPAVLHYNVETQQIVIEDSAGQFISAFRMSKQQLFRVQTTGSIGLE